jgi:[ribosomal protein S5]-alanine N-acetyltransferase
MINAPNNGLTDFVICLKPEDKPIGKIGVWSGDEIGFLLDHSQWRKGLAKEALCGIISYLFTERKFEAITADVDPRNEASLGILKKVGFHVERIQENTLEVGGVWVDSAYLRLTKEVWEKQDLL